MYLRMIRMFTLSHVSTKYLCDMLRKLQMFITVYQGLCGKMKKLYRYHLFVKFKNLHVYEGSVVNTEKDF